MGLPRGGSPIVHEMAGALVLNLDGQRQLSFRRLTAEPVQSRVGGAFFSLSDRGPRIFGAALEWPQ